MSEELSFKEKLQEIINSQAETDRARKESMKDMIDRADNIFEFCLLLFGLGFWVVMILKMFL